jgi:hypothetical protein
MRFKSEGEKPYAPELVASRDETRPLLRHPYLDVGEGEAELQATDSYGAVRFPVEVQDDETAGAVPAEALKAARKRGPIPKLVVLAGEVAEVVEDGSRNGSLLSIRRPDAGGIPGQIGRSFPDLRALWPEDDDVGFEVGIDAELLARVAKAMGTGGRVRLRFMKERGDGRPIRVDPIGHEGPTGLVMPIARR